MLPRTTHFEVPAKDPDKLALFYRLAFGWNVDKWGGPLEYWSVVMGAEGIPVTDRKPDGPSGMAYMANTVEVDNIDFYVLNIIAAGGVVELEKQTILNKGYLAYCADVEGNVFGLWEDDPYAGQ